MYKIDIKAECDECGIISEIEYEHFECEECLKKNEVIRLKEAIEDVMENDRSWEDPDVFEGFETEKDKKLWLDGMKYGFEHALFWIADYYGEMQFWEKLLDKYRHQEKK